LRPGLDAKSLDADTGHDILIRAGDAGMHCAR
jgi:hypothetical protein